ncbi:MAG TPA: alpha/beta hydrolase [Firmicutes bacterium]|nr:alpha/beta hydrolase [Bacillales bacterium]HJA39976.1 alpha/beta hydrolase [Bacillota bacterium]
MKYILLHGLGQASSSWKDTVEAMDSQFDILCPDLSQWLCNKKACYANLYQAFKAYCEPFREPLNLCGLSLGGILALQYGIEHPKKVNSLVLIGTQYTMPKRLLQVQNVIFRILPNSSFQKMGFGKMDFINLSKSMMDLDFQDDLRKIRCRVLVICGDKDKANKSASLRLKKQIPHAEISIIAHAGHEVNLDNPAELGKELNAFFKK